MLAFQQCITATQQTDIKVHTLKAKKAEEGTDKRNESKMSPSKQIAKEDKVISQTSGNKTVAATEVNKNAKCSTNQEIMEQYTEESRLLENIMTEEQIWPTHREVKLVQTVHKPPHLRSKVRTVSVVQFMLVFENSKELRTNLLCFTPKTSVLNLLNFPVLQF
jgi:hypothetical protein